MCNTLVLASFYTISYLSGEFFHLAPDHPAPDDPLYPDGCLVQFSLCGPSLFRVIDAGNKGTKVNNFYKSAVHHLSTLIAFLNRLIHSHHDF